MYKLTHATYSKGLSCSSGRQVLLLLAGTLALLLAACGGGDGGNNGSASKAAAQCTLTAEELDNLTPADVASLPKACDGISFFDVPSIVGLFILGTEIEGLSLKLYVHGAKQNGSPMTLADFQNAVVTVGGIVADPADWDVAPAPPGVLSMAMLADYSTSITDVDLNALGDLYDTILRAAPAGFEAEIINFSTLNLVPSINIKPDPAPYWTGGLPALLAATNVDPAQPREDTPLYDAMGTGLMGPLANAFNPVGDDFGLVERGRPATLLIAQTDGKDTASLTLQLGDITSLIERCHSTVIMLGTLRSEVDAQVLDTLAGTRGAAVNALNTNFLEAAISSYADSLGNLVVFTLSPQTLFANKTVEIDVGGVAASAVEPFDIGAGCQVI